MLRLCARRAVLVALLATTPLAAACGGKTDEAVVAKAGTVVEASGDVAAANNKGTKRPLKVSDSVASNETIMTGADGHVVIELVHNGARWQLGPNMRRVVRESVAWKAPRGTSGENLVESEAAGRPAERNAAGTSTTAKQSFESSPRDRAKDDKTKGESMDPLQAGGGPSGAEGGTGSRKETASGSAAAAGSAAVVTTTPPITPPGSGSASSPIAIAGKILRDKIDSLAACLPAGVSATVVVHVDRLELITVDITGDKVSDGAKRCLVLAASKIAKDDATFPRTELDVSVDVTGR